MIHASEGLFGLILPRIYGNKILRTLTSSNHASILSTIKMYVLSNQHKILTGVMSAKFPKQRLIFLDSIFFSIVMPL